MSALELPVHIQSGNLPLFGVIFRQLSEGGANALLWILAVLVVLWVAAILVFGYIAIILPALFAVPVIFAVLMLITVGK